jgi:hypothetical protein
MKSSVVAVIGVAAVLIAPACSAAEKARSTAGGIQDAVVGAAHDHVKVKLPDLPTPIDLGDLGLDALQQKVTEIFGADETKENVVIVCAAKDLVAAHSTRTTEAAIRQTLTSLGISRSDEQIHQLADATQRAALNSVGPGDLGRTAVAWACQWASS